ncbi:hypothetical protein ACJJIG_02740 [Microbulbifer sp. SSSA007]|uniref:hypothetical protein n=1 Tax=Microbulbifer sp. SSSA007 TaxID=3243379 RepID=UPI0040391D07
MACKGNWVCFDCRVSTRRHTWKGITYYCPDTIGMEGDVKCQHCGSVMKFIGPTIRVPAKRKIKEWQQLREEILAFRQDYFRERRALMVEAVHEAKKNIEKLKRRPFNKEREKLIREYERNLAKYT